MALDAGQPECEGSLYCDDEYQQEGCRWCYEKEQALTGGKVQESAKEKRKRIAEGKEQARRIVSMHNTKPFTDKGHRGGKEQK